jgi:hypothetical protein
MLRSKRRLSAVGSGTDGGRPGPVEKSMESFAKE